MEDQLRKRLKPAETNQLDALSKHIEWLEQDVHLFGVLFYDTHELGELIRDYVQRALSREGVDFQNSKAFKVEPVIFGNKVNIIYSEELPSISFLTNLNISRDGLISRAAKLIFILPEQSYSDWNTYAFDFISRTSGGVCHFHDLANYDVVSIPNFAERDSKVVFLKEEYSNIKNNPASPVVVMKLLNIAQTASDYSEYSFVLKVATLAYSQAGTLSQPYLSAEALRYKVVSLIELGKLERAMELLEEEEGIREKLTDIRGLVSLYSNRAAILSIWGQLEQALTLYRKSEKLCIALGDRQGVAISYYNQANVLSMQGKLRESMNLYKKQEQIAMDTSNDRQLINSYANQANILKKWGRLEESMNLYKKEEQLKERIGDKKGLAHSYGNQAGVLAYWGRPVESLNLHKKEENILMEFNDKHGLSISYGNQAFLYFTLGKMDEAMSLSKKQEELSLDLGNLRGLSNSYSNQGLILKAWERLDEAMTIHKEEEIIKIKLDDKKGLASCYGNQANILRIWERYDEAIDLYKKQQELCEELGDQKGLANSYVNKAVVLSDLGKMEESLSLHRKAKKIYEDMGDKQGLLYSYINEGGVLFEGLNRYSEGIALTKKALTLSRDLEAPQTDYLVDTLTKYEQAFALSA